MGLKVLQATPFFYPAKAYAGISKVAFQVSKELAKRGHEVTVFTTDSLDMHSRIKDSYMCKDGMEITYFKNLNNFLAYKYRLPIPLTMVKTIKRDLETFDLIHLHSLRTIQNVIIHHYARAYGVPYILHLHGIASWRNKLALQPFFDKFLSPPIIRDASKIIVLSDFMSDYMKLDQEKVTVVPNAVDLELEGLPPSGRFRKRLGIDQGHIVLYVGRISRDKCLDFLVKSFYLIRREVEDAFLIIIGQDDGYLSELETLVRNFGLQNDVFLMPFQSIEDLAAAYVDADVLVNPKPLEEFGLTPFEAILCGTPAIVVEGSGCAEWLKRCGGGYFVNFGDVRNLKDLCIKVFDGVGKFELDLMKKRIMNILSLNRIGTVIESIYDDVCDRE